LCVRAAAEEGLLRRRLEAEYVAGRAAADPTLLFHLAQTTADAGDAVRATELYREYLTIGRNDERSLAQTRVAAFGRSRSDDAAMAGRLLRVVVSSY
jgi:predicted TPR repeat methyltransferase